jgi:DNA-directed RNA polymerase specialized sigma24 family protein
MAEHGEPEDPGDVPEYSQEPIPARDAKSRHLSRTRPSAGLVYLQEITDVERAWMRAMTRSVAHHFQVDRDDLLQELQISLLDCDVIDQGRASVRGWLRRRATWRAGDLRRRDRSQRVSGTTSMDDPLFGDLEDLPRAGRPDPDWTVERMAKLGLSRDEAQVMSLLCWGLSIPMKDFAEFTEQTYPAVRQQRSRATRKIRNLFGLDPDEATAYITWRSCDSSQTAAAKLGMTEHQLRTIVRRAESKIMRALDDDVSDVVTTRDKDESDEC